MYMKKVLYLDLDGTLVDFQSGIDRLPSASGRHTGIIMTIRQGYFH